MIANDTATLRRIDALIADECPAPVLRAALFDSNWQIVQASLQALGRRADASAVPDILAVLDVQDGLDLYGAPDQWTLEGAPDAATADTWRCRFRVKQAACHALGAIGQACGAGTVGARGVDRLAAYACSSKEDYCVRAAACQALGLMKAVAARDALQKASSDGEWCTSREAAKALAALGNV
jgi:HEAT repeat protein